MGLFNKNKSEIKSTQPDVHSEHTPPEIVLECHSLPEDPKEREQVINNLKKKRDEILAQRSKK